MFGGLRYLSINGRRLCAPILERTLNLKLRLTLSDLGGAARIIHTERMLNCSSGLGPKLAHRDLILFPVTAA